MDAGDGVTEPQWNDAHYKVLLDVLEEGVVLLDREGRQDEGRRVSGPACKGVSAAR